MAFAIRSWRRVRMARPRNPLSKHRRIILKTATGGLAAAAAVVLTVTTAMHAAGWLLTAATRDRSEWRPVIALASPLDRPAPIARSARMASPPAVVVAALWPAAERSFDTPVLNPLGALALVVPDSMDMAEEIFAEPVITGSIGRTPFKLAALDVGSGGGRPERLPQSDDAHIFDAHGLPLPRPRPR